MGDLMCENDRTLRCTCERKYLPSDIYELGWYRCPNPSRRPPPDARVEACVGGALLVFVFFIELLHMGLSVNT